MVVVTIIADSNDHTIGKSKYIRLLSCSLYNSWYNLRRRGEISISDRKENASIQLIPPAILCKYSLESLTKPWGNIKWRKRINSLNESMTILNSQKKKFKLDRDRPLPLAIDQRLQEKKLHLSIYFFQQLSCPLWSFGQGWKPIQWLMLTL